MIKFFVVILFPLSFNSYSSEFIICTKGKIKIGDSYDKFIDYCGKSSSSYNGMRALGKSNTPMMFKTLVKEYPDGSKIRFLFLDDKLAFVFDS